RPAAHFSVYSLTKPCYNRHIRSMKRSHTCTPMKHRSLRNLLVGIASALALLWAIAGAKTAAPPSLAGTSHALILVGLPGDDEHDKLFATIAGQWRTWLTGSLGFAPDDVQVLFGRAGKTGLAKGDARRASIESTVSALKKSLRREDRLWVFLL